MQSRKINPSLTSFVVATARTALSPAGRTKRYPSHPRIYNCPKP